MGGPCGDWMPIENWQVDYLDGRKLRSVKVPHSWNLEKSVVEAGPVRYRTVIEKPGGASWLLFHGVAYSAKIFIEGEAAAEHHGLWDAFSIRLPDKSGAVSIEVEVVKNGGATFPVERTLAGQIPYIFQTFGGLFRKVEMWMQEADPVEALFGQPEGRLSCDGSRLELDGKPFFMRGVVHQGWYPQLGRPTPGIDQIEKEVGAYRGLGFNTIKFHQWLPPQDYLTHLDQIGMCAVVELPLGRIELDQVDEEEVLAELERIIRQYRRHRSIIGWTAGSTELAEHHPHFCRRMLDLIHGLTNCPLVGIPSFGVDPLRPTVSDQSSFEPLVVNTELCFLPEYLKGLERPEEAPKPAILGDFGAFDHHRDLARLQDEHPYWASVLPEYNSPGVRDSGPADLAQILGSSAYAHEPRQSDHLKVLESSRRKGAFMREMMVRGARNMSGLSGYIMNSSRDNPVSTSGLLDDWGDPRIHPSQTLKWNGPTALYLKRPRQAYRTRSSLRLGWSDPFCTFVGEQEMVIGIHSEEEFEAGGLWRLIKDGKTLLQERIPSLKVVPCRAQDAARFRCRFDAPGTCLLEIELGPAKMTCPMEVFSDAPLVRPITLWVEPSQAWRCEGASDLGVEVRTYTGGKLPDSGLLVLTETGVETLPFWSGCTFTYPDDFLSSIGLEDAFTRMLAMTPDSAIDPGWLLNAAGTRDVRIRMTRLDTRTYAEHPLLATVDGRLAVTTLRPFGGLGASPPVLARTPSGLQLLRDLSSALDRASS